MRYRSLGPKDRTENIRPEPLLARQLSWAATDSTQLRPRGSIVDIVKEETGQQILFILGVGAGIASTAVPLLLSWMAKRTRFLWRLRRRSARG